MNITSRFFKLTAISLLISVIGTSTSLYAAPVVISDSPPLDINTVKPNIMFTLDTSGSMSEVSVPDDFAVREGQNCFKNHIANPLYFNPNATYELPKSYDGATNTVTTLPDVDYNNAPWDGFNTNSNYKDDVAVTNTFVNTTARINLNLRFRPDFKYDQTNPGQQFEGGYYYEYAPTAPFLPYVPASAGPPAVTEVLGNPAVAVPGVCHIPAAYKKVLVNAATPAVQKQFAIWFSYYRSRMQAMKSAAGLAFGDLDKNDYRVGFHNIWNTNGSFLNVLDFAGAHRQSWYTRFYASVPANATPLRAATIRVGEYFRTGVMQNVAGSIDPIQQSCQPNYHILSTDGYWNEGTPGFNPLSIGNVDNIVPVLPTREPPLTPITSLTAGTAWPRLYRESGAPVVAPAIDTLTLADIATKYWVTDLRPGTGPGQVNNVPASDDKGEDPASWQHVVMFGVAIAAKGSLPYNVNDSKVAAQTLIDLGDNPNSVVPTPNPAIQYNAKVWPYPTNLQPTAIDDLWHAAVNSRGQFFNVNDAPQLSAALRAALNKIGSGGGSASGAGLATPNLSADSVAYVPSYKSGVWSGELSAQVVNPVTGQGGAVLWLHSEKLFAQAGGTGWDVKRKLLTKVGTTTVPFRYGSLNATQQASLGATAAERQAVLNYLRGERLHEDQTNSIYKFRPRVETNILGDIIQSEPRAIAAPRESYADSFNPGYQAFRIANASRIPMVYFGANDGFLHAVNGEKTGTNAGNEMFAYMPSQLLRTGATGIAALTYKPLDLPPKKFTHKFYVDGIPFSRDVDFSRTSQSSSSPTPTSAATPDWRTVMITGLGKGGSSYVALDVTTPPTGTETEAALATSGRILWEFTDPDMGFTYGKPAIVKTARYGWVALLAGGYNNISGTNAGKGIIYVVDVKTGTLLHKFITPDGSATDPLGLAHLDAFIPDGTDYTATEIYAGDLFGNVWRFDISATTAYSTNGVKLAQLRDASNNPQPITSYPLPYIDPINGKRFVAVGTGKLLDPTDLTDLSQQTFYNVADGSVYLPKTTGLPVTRAGLSPVSRTTNAANLADTIDGWYQDLLPTGERIIKESLALFGVVVPTTIKPSTDPCSRGGIGTVYARAATTANNQIPGGATFIGGGATDKAIVGVRVVKLADGTPAIQILTGDSKISTLDVPFPGGFRGTVVNYREVIE
jgi:type IV pilus assembly protein PilY1